MNTLINECLQSLSQDLNLTRSNLTTSDGEKIINFKVDFAVNFR